NGLFCKYWIMSKQNFNAYMEWSAPLIHYALENPDSYAQKTPRALAYLVERLFICWSGIKQKRALQVEPLVRTVAVNRVYRAHRPGSPGQHAVQACVTDKDGDLTTLYRTDNRSESSSVLPLGTHLKLFPTIHLTAETRLETTTFRSLAERERLKLADYDMLVI